MTADLHYCTPGACGACIVCDQDPDDWVCARCDLPVCERCEHECPNSGAENMFPVAFLSLVCLIVVVAMIWRAI